MITNWYQVQRQLFNNTIAEFIKHNSITGMTYAEL